MKIEEQEIQKKRKLLRPKTVWLREEVFNLVWLYAKEHNMNFGTALEELVKKGLFKEYGIKPPPED
jgi:hypothetical protein